MHLVAEREIFFVFILKMTEKLFNVMQYETLKMKD